MFRTVAVINPSDDEPFVIARDVINNEIASAIVDKYCDMYNITDDLDAVATDVNGDEYDYDFENHGWLTR